MYTILPIMVNTVSEYTGRQLKINASMIKSIEETQNMNRTKINFIDNTSALVFDEPDQLGAKINKKTSDIYSNKLDIQA